MPNCAVLLAGGSGKRMRGSVKDKVLAHLQGLPVILHSYKAFEESGEVDEVVFVCRDDAQIKQIKRELKKNFAKSKLLVKFTYGGAERQDSVLNGLKEVSDKQGLAFIHDGARPMISVQNIKELSCAALKDGASVLASRVSDTIKRIAKGKKSLSKCKLADLERNRLWAMQTPQVFVCQKIKKAYEFIKKNKIAITDDVAAFTVSGGKVTIVENLSANVKITVPEDIAFIEFLKSKGKK